MGAEDLLNKANHSFEKGNLSKALELAENAMKIYEKQNDLDGKGTALSAMALYNRKMGNIEKGYELLEEALELFKAVGNVFGCKITENLIKSEKQMDESEKKK